MTYITAFLEGLLSFISPCVLPLIPIYIGYFSGGIADERNNGKLIINTLLFIAGFTLLFVILGATASTAGAFFNENFRTINIVFGVILILLRLNFFGLNWLPFLNNTKKMKFSPKGFNPLTSFLFGLAFAIGWSPCTGPFLGSALMKAANTSTVGQGMFTLFMYALGIGVPFFLTAILLDQLGKTFEWIKKHYGIIEKISGAVILIFGIVLIVG